MDSRDVLGYLKELCGDLDAGKAPRSYHAWMRALVVPVAVPAAMALGVCLGAGCRDDDSGATGEICTNNIDDDGDGAVDCADAECSEEEACLPVAAYGVPFDNENCSDGFDNDFDGLTDCADTGDCLEDPACLAQPEYAAVFEDCGDDQDNDGDGDIDCLDSDCAEATECMGGVLYGAVFEGEVLCDDGLDNDGDGDKDCADQDCIDAGHC
jgi:hypothetical protein